MASATPRVIKRVVFIANQGSGKQAQSLQELCDILDDAGITYALKVLKRKDDIARLIGGLKPGDYDAVIVYGGDGTVLRIGHKLCGGKTPLCILPGGTNNGLAAALQQVMAPAAALQALVEGHYEERDFDVAQFNDRPVIFDLHYGFFAKTITQTSRLLKQRVGTLAYAFQAIRQMQRAETHDFALMCDGRAVKATAVMCYISNAGLPQLLGVPIFKGYKANDGLLDIVFVTTNRFWPLIRWYAARVLFGRAGTRAVVLHRAKKIEVIQAPANVFYDDVTTTTKPPFTLRIRRRALPILVPLAPTLAQRAKNAWLRLTTQFWRTVDQTRRVVFGMSALRFSRLDDHLFMGGQPGRFWGAQRLQRWGITAVVSMRLRKPRHIPKNVALLHLPTPNYDPVKLADLRRGCEFIEEQIKQGGSVYVHCQAGEGRAASMIIACLINRGMFLRDALAFIKQHRVYIKPNQRQIARLRQFAHEVRARQK